MTDVISLTEHVQQSVNVTIGGQNAVSIQEQCTSSNCAILLSRHASRVTLGLFDGSSGHGGFKFPRPTSHVCLDIRMTVVVAGSSASVPGSNGNLTGPANLC